MHLHTCACTCTCFTERWEGRKKEASKVKQTTRQSNTAHPRQSLFLRKIRQKNELSQVELEPTTLYTLDRTSYITAAHPNVHVLGELSVQWDVLVDVPVGSSSLWSFGIHTHTHSHSYIHHIVNVHNVQHQICTHCTITTILYRFSCTSHLS